MSMVDVKEYYVEVKDQFLEMYNLMDEYNLAYKEGRISKEQLDDIKDSIQLLKENYERVSYIMFLFNKPKSQKNRKKSHEENAFYEGRFNYIGADKKTIINENTYVLNDIKKYLESIKVEDNE